MSRENLLSRMKGNLGDDLGIFQQWAHSESANVVGENLIGVVFFFLSTSKNQNFKILFSVSATALSTANALLFFMISGLC